MAVIFGTNGADVLRGTLLNDVLVGNGGNDTLLGGAGNDQLGGGAGVDLLYGEAGNDLLVGGADGDLLVGGTGDDQLYGQTGVDLLYGEDGNDYMLGGADGDRLEGGAGNDQLFGEAGVDLLFGQDGNDYILGGTEGDLVDGGAGADILFGETGNDIVLGGADGDYADGGAGNDLVRGDAGNDTVLGGAGDDRVEGGSGDDDLSGDAGDDLLEGGAGDDTVSGGDGLDTAIFSGIAADYDIVAVGTDLQVTHARGTMSDGTDTVNVDVERLQFSDTTIDFTTNVAPTGVDDSGATGQDATLNAPTVLGNDIDLEAGLGLQTLSVSEVNGSAASVGTQITLTSGALLTVQADGTYEYDPNDAFDSLGNGETDTETFTYTVSDGTDTDTATVTITLTGTNDAPLGAVTITGLGVENGAATVVDLLQGVTDADGDALSITGLATTTTGLSFSELNGVISLDMSGFEDLGVGATEVVTFNYTVDDGNGGTLARTLDVTVTGANDGPVATAVSLTTPAVEDSAFSFDVSTLFSDVDTGDTLTYTVAGVPAGIVFDGTMTLSGTPADSDVGSYTVSITASDGNSGSLTRTFEFDVNNINDDPVAVTDAVTTDEDVAVTFNPVANDTDDDGDTLSIMGTPTVTGGTVPGIVTVNGDGTVTFTPAANQNGTATITYTVADGNGGMDTGTVSVTVNAVNDPPNDAPSAGAPIAGAANEADTPASTFDLLANASDIDMDTLSAVNLIQVSGPTVTASINGSNELEIDMTQAALNGLSAGETADLTFTFDVSDGNGGFDDSVAIITVTGTNDVPTGAAALTGAGTENGAATVVDLLQGVTDVDGDALSITGLATTTTGLSFSESGGTLTLDMSGFEDLGVGATEVVTFNYTVDDGNGGTLARTLDVTVTGANDAPVATGVTLSTPAVEDSAFSFDVSTLFSDVDTGDTLTYTVTGVPAGIVFDGTMTLSGTPADSDVGSYTVSITASDGNSGSLTRTFEFDVNNINDDPVAVADAVTTDEDVAVTFNPVANDTDIDGDTLSIMGTPTVAGGAAVGAIVVNGDGTITFTPAANTNGSATINYVVQDGNGGTANGTATVTVTSVNDAPDAGATITGAASESNTAATSTFDLLANATDVDVPADTLSALNLAQVSGPMVTASIVANELSIDMMQAAFDGLAAGETMDLAFTFDVSDGAGGTDSSATIITVTGTNDVPTGAAAITGAGTENGAATVVDLLQGVTDVDGDALSITGLATTTTGLSFSESGGTLTLDMSGFEDLGVGATEVVTFNYTVDDGNGGTLARTLDVTVTGANDAPVATGVTLSTPAVEDSAFSFDVSTLFSDVDTGDTLTYTVAGVPAGIVFDGTMTLSGTPADSDVGSYTVSITASDGNSGSLTRTFEFDVNNVNDDPVAVADAVTTDEDVAVTFNPVANDTDIDGDTLSIMGTPTVVGGAAVGAIVVNGDGTITFTPAANTNGSATINYVVQDGNGGTANGTATVTVTSVNDAPVAADGTATGAEDAAGGIAIDVASLISDVEDADTALTVAATVPASQGTVAVVGTVITFAPALNFNGDAAISYTVTDTTGTPAALVDGGTIAVTVTAVNDDPTAPATNSVTTLEDTVSAPIMIGGGDVDGDALSYSIKAGAAPAKGTVTFAGDAFVYTPTADANGADSFTILIDDGIGGTPAEQVVTVTVTSVNDAPVAADAMGAHDEDVADSVVLATVAASDVDLDTLSFTISAGDPGGLFEINSMGQVSLATGMNLDRETAAQHVLEVTVGDGSLTDTATVTIDVNDVNEFGVVGLDDVNGAANTVVENAAGGTVVAITALASDADATNSDVTYAITGGAGMGLFAIDPTSGVVTVAGMIDRETLGASVDIEVTATSQDSSTDVETFTIDIQDADEFDVSSISDSDSATSNQVAEGEAAGTAVGVTALATDGDATNNGVTYSLDDSAGGRFTIDANSGVVTTAMVLDFEDATSHNIIVRATSQDGSSSTGNFSVAVTDVNDTAPEFTSSDVVDFAENGTGAVLTLATSDADGVGTNPATLIKTGGADQAAFAVMGNQLVFVGAPDFENSTDVGSDGVYEVTVTANDGVNSTNQTILVTVTDVNEAPTAVAFSGTTTTIAENTEIGGGIKVADIDVTDDALGTNTLDLTGADASDFEIRGTELYFVGTSPDFETQATYNVTVTVDDTSIGAGVDAMQVFTLTISDVNDAPVGVDDTGSITEDSGPLSVAAAAGLLSNDTDPDGAVTPGTSHLVSMVNGVAANGTNAVAGGYGSLVASADGSWTYTLDGRAETLAAGETADEVFTYEIQDQGAGTPTATAQITVTVTGQNDAPIANIDVAQIDLSSQTTINVDVLANDTDVDATDTLSIASLVDADAGVMGFQTANGGTIEIVAGQVEYTPGTGAFFTSLGSSQQGVDSFSYNVTDGTVVVNQTAYVLVTGINDAPELDLDAGELGNDFMPGATGAAESEAGAGTVGTTVGAGEGVVIANGPDVEDPDFGDTFQTITITLADPTDTNGAGGSKGFVGLTSAGSTLATSLGVTVASDGSGGLTITAPGAAQNFTASQAEALISEARFVNNEQTFAMDTDDREITVTVTDAGGLPSAAATATIPVIANVTDTGGVDMFVGTALGDTIDGLGGSDTIEGGAGDDIISDTGTGMGEVDTAVYADARSGYTVGQTLDGDDLVTAFTSVTESTVVNVDEGADTLTGIEQLSFASGATVLDLADPVQVFDSTGQLVGTFDLIEDAINDATNGADAGYTVRVNGATYAPATAENLTISEGITLVGVGSVTVASIAISGGGGGSIDIDNIDVAATAATSAIDVASTSNFASITYQNGDVTGGVDHGLFVGGNTTTGTPNVLSVTIDNATFDGNASGTATGGEGAITFFGYNGNVTLTDVTVENPVDAQNGIQIRGTDSLASMGVVTLDDVSVTGSFSSTGVAIRSYTTNGLVFVADGGTDALTVNVTGGTAYAGLQVTVGGDVDLLGAESVSITNGSTNPTGRDIQVDGDSAGTTLTGDDSSDLIIGGLGADTINAGAGDDIILEFAGDGADTIDGGTQAAADVLLVSGTDGFGLPGMTADDTVTINVADVGMLTENITTVDGGAVSGIEATALDLGSGTDTLSYSGNTEGVSVDLDAATASGFTGIPGAGPIPATPAIAGVENVTGGDGADDLRGDAGANTLSGGGNDDMLKGRGGDDTIIGGANGAGTFGDTAVYDGNYADSTITFNDTTGEITVTDNNVTGGDEGTDTLTGVETIDFADRDVHIVDGSGQFGAFTTVQDAVNAAADGDVIFIMPGTYNEDVVLDKSLDIVGQGAATGDVTIGSITIDDAALELVSDSVLIENVTVSGGTASSGISYTDTTGAGETVSQGTLSVVDSEISGFAAAGLNVGTSGVGAEPLTSIDVIITNSGFTGNGTNNANGSNDINLFNFGGDATLTGVTISNDATTPASGFGSGEVTPYAIQIAGFTGSAAAASTVDQPIGDISFDGVVITGDYNNGLVIIHGYTALDNLDLNGAGSGGLTLGDAGTTSGGTGLQINPDVGMGSTFTPGAVTTSDVDLTGVTIAGGTYQGFGTGAAIFVNGSTTAPIADTVTGTDNAAGTLEAYNTGQGDDTIDAKGGDDIFFGGTGGGANTFDGGAGDDTVSLFNVIPAPVTFTISDTGADTIDVGNGTTDVLVQMGVSTGDATFGSVTMDNVEDIIITLGAGGDTVVVTTPLTGTSLSVSTITVVGGDGDDTVAAGMIDGAQPVGVTFTGGDGDDTFISGAGIDNFVAGEEMSGADQDTISFAGSAGPVNVDMTAGTATGDADDLNGATTTDMDTFSGVENVIGSSGADTIAGDANDNIIAGNGGADMITGGGATLGADTDTAVFAGVQSDYTITFNANGTLSVENNTTMAVTNVGTDVEQIGFSPSGTLVDLTDDTIIDLTLGVRVFNASMELIETHATIQAAIDDADTMTGFTVQVLADDYSAEGVITVDKDISLVGPNFGNDPNVTGNANMTLGDADDDRVPEATVVAVNVTAAGATVDGFEISGATANGVTVGGVAGVTISNNIITGATDDGIQATGGSGLMIANNLITGAGDEAISISGVTAAMVSDNVLADSGAANGAAILLEGALTGSTVSNNKLTGKASTANQQGILLGTATAVSGVTVTGNTFASFAAGIVAANAAAAVNINQSIDDFSQLTTGPVEGPAIIDFADGAGAVVDTAALGTDDMGGGANSAPFAVTDSLNTDGVAATDMPTMADPGEGATAYFATLADAVASSNDDATITLSENDHTAGGTLTIQTALNDLTVTTLTGTSIATASIELTGATAQDITITGDADVEVTGSASDNVIDGTTASGDLTITGMAGNDTLTGGSGDDLFIEFAGDGADTITGGGNSGAGTRDAIVILDNDTADDTVNVVFSGASASSTDGADIASIDGGTVAGVETITAALDLADTAGTAAAGGPGSDTLDYTGSTTSVAADLLAGTASGFAANTAVTGAVTTAISGFENVTGAGMADALTGDAGANILSGAGGDDVLQGGEGADMLFGGDSTADAGTADEAVYVGSVRDFTVTPGTTGGIGITPDLVTSFAGVTDNNTATGTADDMLAEGTDTLSGIELITFRQGDGVGPNDVTLDLADNIQLFDSADNLVGTFNTLSDALGSSSNGDTLLLKGGVSYVAGTTVSTSVTIVSTDGTAILTSGLLIDADNTVIGSAGHGFEFSGGTLQLASADNVTAEDNVFTPGADTTAIDAGSSANFMLIDNTINVSGSAGDGVVLYAGSTAVLTDNTITGSTGANTGVTATGAGSGADLSGGGNDIGGFVAGVFATSGANTTNVSGAGNDLTDNTTAVWFDTGTSGNTVNQTLASLDSTGTGAEVVDVDDANTVTLAEDHITTSDLTSGSITGPTGTMTDGTGYFEPGEIQAAFTASDDGATVDLVDTGTATDFGVANVTANNLTVNGTTTGTEAQLTLTGTGAQDIDLTGVADIDVTGNGDANVIDGNDGVNELIGLAGNDTLNGQGGADIITGGAGDDTMSGGAGDDDFIIASAADHAAGETIDGGAGTADQILFTSTAGQTLELDASTTNVEEVRISDAAGATNGTTDENVDASAVSEALEITGNDGGNIITGTLEDDTLTGNGGDDVFIISLGAHHGAGESIAGGADNDIIRFTSTTADDTLTLSGNLSGVEEIRISDALGATTGVVDLNIDASAESDGFILTGNAGDNVLTGSTGTDTFIGGTEDGVAANGDYGDIAVIVGVSENNISFNTVTGNWEANGEVLENIETVMSGGSNYLLVGGTSGDDGFASVAEAILAAQAGDTILLAGGMTFTENLTINEGVRLLGANHGTSGSAGGRVSESTIAGTIAVAGSAAVTIDGIRMFDDAGTTSRITFNSAEGHTVQNSVFVSDQAGSNTAIDSAVTVTGTAASLNINDNAFGPEGAGDGWDQGVALSLGTGVSVDITGNTFDSAGAGGTAAAISISNYQDGGNNISGNTVANSDVGMLINVANPGGAITDVTGNDFDNVVLDLDLRSAGGSIEFDQVAASNTATGAGEPTDPVLAIAGSSGDDTITGSSAIDSLIGGAGADTLSGAGGGDRIEGGAGDDMLYGDGDDGDDATVGVGETGGGDLFVFDSSAASTGDDLIFNFEFGNAGAAEDVVDLTGYGFTNFNAISSEIAAGASQGSTSIADVVIDLQNGSTITLVDVTLASIDTDGVGGNDDVLL